MTASLTRKGATASRVTCHTVNVSEIGVGKDILKCGHVAVTHMQSRA